ARTSRVPDHGNGRVVLGYELGVVLRIQTVIERGDGGWNRRRLVLPGRRRTEPRRFEVSEGLVVEEERDPGPSLAVDPEAGADGVRTHEGSRPLPVDPYGIEEAVRQVPVEDHAGKILSVQGDRAPVHEGGIHRVDQVDVP